MTSIPIKCCSRKEHCIHPDGPYLPATTEYFYRDKYKKSGLHVTCRACRAADQRKHKREDPERHREYVRQHRLRPGVKDREREYNKQWATNNPEKRQAQKQREWERHRERYRQQKQTYYQANREKFLGRYHTPKGRAQILATEARRRARKHSLPDTFTSDDWQRALDYFGGCCAICGRPPGLWHALSADHWIPLASPDCPGTIATNIIPLCCRQDGCNNSKRHKDPEQWLIERFGKRKAKVILKRIHAYFEYVRSKSSD